MGRNARNARSLSRGLARRIRGVLSGGAGWGRVRARFLVLVLVLLASGCATQDSPRTTTTEASPTPASATPASPTPSSSTEPTPTPSAATPTPTPAPPVPEPEPAACPPAPFDHAFTDATMVDKITPLGGIGTGGLGRTYVFLRALPNGTYPFAPLYAPGNVTLTALAYYTTSYGAVGGRAEYRLELDVGCGVQLQFAHVGDVVPRIAALQPTPTSTSADSWYGREAFRAGELLGHANGTSTAGSWDVVLLDRNAPEAHANPARWVSDQNRFATCPYDRFVEPLRAQYYALFATASGARPATPSCRNASIDAPGTAAGSWFQGDANEQSGPRLDIATQLDGSVDVGERRESEPIARVTDPKPDAPLPEDVTPGGRACYATGSEHVDVKLTDATTLLVARGPGPCPAAFDAAAARTWTR